MLLASLKDRTYKASLFFTGDFYNSNTKRLFFKALILFTLIKMMALWSFSAKVMSLHVMSLPRSLFGKILLAPALLANYHINVFFTASALFLFVLFFVRPNYIIAIFFFLLTFNLYVVFLPFATGAELVLFMLALWYIPMANEPILESKSGMQIQKAFYNLATLLCQLQVVFIYFTSGWDKLLSDTWRSGEAFDYVIHLNTLYNPRFTGWFENASVQGLLSWTTILFELAFVVMVWFEKTRLYILLFGVFVHLFIGVVISLPDFATLMIISYIIFLKDGDLSRVSSWFKR